MAFQVTRSRLLTVPPFNISLQLWAIPLTHMHETCHKNISTVRTIVKMRFVVFPSSVLDGTCRHQRQDCIKFCICYGTEPNQTLVGVRSTLRCHLSD